MTFDFSPILCYKIIELTFMIMQRIAINSGRVFILELHDITPYFYQEFKVMLEWSGKFQSAIPLILCIPFWMGKKHPACLKQFSSLIDHTPGTFVLHGFKHFTPGGHLDRLRYGQSLKSEFKNLNQDTAFNLISRGKKLLEGWSYRPVNWFCPPRWQHSWGTIKALKKLKFEGLLLKNQILLLDGRKIPIPVISFDFGTGNLVSMVNHWLVKLQIKHLIKHQKPFRLALHPRDLKNHKIIALLNKLLQLIQMKGYQPVSLDEVIQSYE